MKLQKYITIFVFFTSLTAVCAQEHTRFIDLPLDLAPEEIIETLEDKGLQREDLYELSGRIAGLDVWLYVNVSKDSTKVNQLLLTTQTQQGKTLRDDYVALRKWMQKHYGTPTWESTVRSHSFARWYVGYDRDIVMIATASAGVEIWFYENHQRRNIDYYAILKYCERVSAKPPRKRLRQQNSAVRRPLSLRNSAVSVSIKFPRLIVWGIFFTTGIRAERPQRRRNQ